MRRSVSLLALATFFVVAAASAQPPDDLAPARAAARQILSDCHAGSVLQGAIGALPGGRVSALAGDRDRTVRLVALWERERRIDGEHLEDAGVTRFLRVLETDLGSAPPAWWAATLRTARFHPSTLATSYDATPARIARFTEVVPWGSGRVHAPAGVSLSDVPPPTDPHEIDHVDVARAGARIVVAPFSPGRGGFPLEIRAYRTGGVDLAWRATACSASRGMLAGLGELALQMTIEPDEVRVWTAESHGLAIDALDLATGAVRWRFSTDFWMARH